MPSLHEVLFCSAMLHERALDQETGKEAVIAWQEWRAPFVAWGQHGFDCPLAIPEACVVCADVADVNEVV